jgi:hypothetical protein
MSLLMSQHVLKISNFPINFFFIYFYFFVWVEDWTYLVLTHSLIAFSMMPIIFHSVPLIPLNATFFPFRCVSASLVSSCQLKIKWKLTKFWLFAITSFCPKRIHCTPMLQALIPKAPIILYHLSLTQKTFATPWHPHHCSEHPPSFIHCLEKYCHTP